MAMAMGRPTRSGELRASDDMMDHRGVAIAEEGYSAPPDALARTDSPLHGHGR
eukprot:COSAG03_NODE_22163_length_294_cov_1.492308_1_plen_52_part_10